MIPDVLDHNLKIVFCETDSANTPADREQYYAAPGNRFWAVLYRVGLTPVQLRPEECRSAAQYGIGLTDLARRNGGTGAAAGPNGFDCASLEKKVRKFKPRVLCFNGKKAAKGYFGRRNVEYGFQEERIGDTRTFVAPSTCASANRYWDEKWWFMLADSVGSNVTKVDLANYYMPDEICRMMKSIDPETGQDYAATEDDFIRAVNDIGLHYSLPLHIKNMFEIAKALFAYGYLYYPFCTLAVEQALKSLEAVVANKYDAIGGPKYNRKGLPPAFADKINFLFARGLISGAQKEVLHDCRQLRNMSFHPRYQQILGHHDGALRVIAGLMNEVWLC